jgi:predicted RNase H-like nuclease (RuvC/YqgF family)
MSEPADFPERAIQAAQNLLKKGAEVARQQTRAVRLQTQISRLRDQKRKLYSAMGQKVYALFQKDLVRNADLRLLCQQITKLDSDIGLSEEELDQLRRRTSRRDVEGGVDAEEMHGDNETSGPPDRV